MNDSVNSQTEPLTGDISAVRRGWAAVALVALLVSIGAVVVFLVKNPSLLALGIAGLAVGAAGAWWALTELGAKRYVGLVVTAAGVALIGVALAQTASRSSEFLLRAAILAALLLLAGAATRFALVEDLHQIDRLESGPAASTPPRQPVLICNPWSGGGKVAKFNLVEKAEKLGVKVILLAHGLDLEQLARDAVANGADCLGMAGGDGSQALVASIAIEAGIPFVCISAGTRNHFAQDLGLDRDDPSTGLIAFTQGAERSVDFARVGDRLFVNNVSLGVYATIVQESSYRDDKVGTSTRLLPELLGSQTEPFDLQFTDPQGEEVEGTFLLMVSNNPYVMGPSLDVAQRRSMDTGELGVFSVSASSGAEAARLVAESSLGLFSSNPNVHQFTARSFEVRSRSGKAFAGIDGESLELETPLRFECHPLGLQLLVPPNTVAIAEARKARGVKAGALFDIVRGRHPDLRSPRDS